MGFMTGLAREQPELYLMIVAGVVLSIVLHELGHALTATWEGDPTPRARGHLTWDPRVHMGWLSLAMVALLGIGFGMCPVNPRHFRHRRWGETLVYGAGPAVNLLVGLVAALVLALIVRFGEIDPEAPSAVLLFWTYMAWLNFALFVFNMIPVFPFDGATVFAGLVRSRELLDATRRWHPWPLVGAFVFAERLGVFDLAEAMMHGAMKGAGFLVNAV